MGYLSSTHIGQRADRATTPAHSGLGRWGRKRCLVIPNWLIEQKKRLKVPDWDHYVYWSSKASELRQPPFTYVRSRGRSGAHSAAEMLANVPRQIQVRLQRHGAGRHSFNILKINRALLNVKLGISHITIQ